MVSPIVIEVPRVRNADDADAAAQRTFATLTAAGLPYQPAMQAARYVRRTWCS